MADFCPGIIHGANNPAVPNAFAANIADQAILLATDVLGKVLRDANDLPGAFAHPAYPGSTMIDPGAGPNHRYSNQRTG